MGQPGAVISDFIQAHIVFTSKKNSFWPKKNLMRNLNFDNNFCDFFSDLDTLKSIANFM